VCERVRACQSLVCESLVLLRYIYIYLIMYVCVCVCVCMCGSCACAAMCYIHCVHMVASCVHVCVCVCVCVPYVACAVCMCRVPHVPCAVCCMLLFVLLSFFLSVCVCFFFNFCFGFYKVFWVVELLSFGVASRAMHVQSRRCAVGTGHAGVILVRDKFALSSARSVVHPGGLGHAVVVYRGFLRHEVRPVVALQVFVVVVVVFWFLGF